MVTLPKIATTISSIDRDLALALRNHHARHQKDSTTSIIIAAPAATVVVDTVARHPLRATTAPIVEATSLHNLLEAVGVGTVTKAGVYSGAWAEVVLQLPVAANPTIWSMAP